MKIAVLSDIHANYVALQAIYEDVNQWGADIVVIAGDIINRGPRPADCLDFVLCKTQTDGWRIIRGNHEDYVISWKDPKRWKSGNAAQVHQASRWTYQKIGHNSTEIEQLPYQHSFWDLDKNEIRIVHASILGNRDGIYPETPDQDLASKIGLTELIPAPLILCVGHTHRPLIRYFSGITVINAGSAGLPFDGDTRPSYAQLTLENRHWQARIARVEYNLTEALRDFHTSGYLEEAGPLSKIVQIELREARSLLYYWAVKYQKRAITGSISMRDSVDEFIYNLHF